MSISCGDNDIEGDLVILPSVFKSLTDFYNKVSAYKGAHGVELVAESLTQMKKVQLREVRNGLQKLSKWESKGAEYVLFNFGSAADRDQEPECVEPEISEYEERARRLYQEALLTPPEDEHALAGDKLALKFLEYVQMGTHRIINSRGLKAVSLAIPRDEQGKLINQDRPTIEEYETGAAQDRIQQERRRSTQRRMKRRASEPVRNFGLNLDVSQSRRTKRNGSNERLELVRD